MTDWYQLETKDVIQTVGSDSAAGLTADEVQRRLQEHGPNELTERAAKSPWAILWEQFTGIMVIMLIASAVISIILGEYTDALVIMIIVVLNAVLGFTQEYKAEKAMEALKRMAAP